MSSICQEFLANPTINPRTRRRITPTGKVYQALVQECGSGQSASYPVNNLLASYAPMPPPPTPPPTPPLPVNYQQGNYQQYYQSYYQQPTYQPSYQQPAYQPSYQQRNYQQEAYQQENYQLTSSQPNINSDVSREIQYCGRNIPRRADEDRYIVEEENGIFLCGVFDGHGMPLKKEYENQDISASVIRHTVTYLERTFYRWFFDAIANIDVEDSEAFTDTMVTMFRQLDKYLYDNNYEAGSTASLVAITPYTIYQINLGDSRSIVMTDDDMSVSTDDKPVDERERITSLGGVVNRQGYIINDDGSWIAVSRTFGDFQFKRDSNGDYTPDGLVLVMPTIISTLRTPQVMVIVGSDGLFDVVTDMDDFIYRMYNSSNPDPCQEVINIVAGEEDDSEFRGTDDVTFVVAWTAGL